MDVFIFLIKRKKEVKKTGWQLGNIPLEPAHW
jgi:hypothetical protein